MSCARRFCAELVNGKLSAMLRSWTLIKPRAIASLALCFWLLCAWQSGNALARGNASTSPGGNELVSADTRARLQDIEKRRKELAEQAEQARKKEKLAFIKLNKIQTRLNVTTGALMDSKHKLRKTESRLTETQVSLDYTITDEMKLSDRAANRLREIYEGQRLNLVEMVFQVQSLQALLDLFYYQERIAAMDRELLDRLREKASALAARKDKLGEQKNRLGDLVLEFAKKALQISQERNTQEQIAEKLRTQRAFYEQAERQLALESEQLEHQICDMESARKTSSKEIVRGSGNMKIPLAAQITSPFGIRVHPIFHVRKFHTGVDLSGPNHSAIKAADSGNVLYAGFYGGYGRVVIISHGNGLSTLYAHLSSARVSVGENVAKGDVVGYEGTTGFSTGPHLHWEVRVNGKPNNPLNFLK